MPDPAASSTPETASQPSERTDRAPDAPRELPAEPAFVPDGFITGPSRRETIATRLLAGLIGPGLQGARDEQIGNCVDLAVHLAELLIAKLDATEPKE